MATYNERVEFFVQRYSSLVKSAEKLSFPKFQPGFPKDSVNWGAFRRMLYRFAHPFLSGGKSGFWETTGFLFLLLVAQANFGWWIMLLAPALYGMQSFLDIGNIGGVISLILALIGAIPLSVVAYYWWFDVLTSKKYPGWLRLIFVGGVLFFSWAFTRAILADSITRHVINSKSDILPTLLAFLLFLIPSLSYLAMLFYESVSFLLHLIDSFSKGLKSLHEPLPVETVKKLALEDIADDQSKQTWKLQDLSLHEIQTLRKWAEVNRESTDKRTLPTIVVIAFLTLLLASDTARGWLDPYVQQWFQRILSFWTMRTGVFTKDYFIAAFIVVITILVLGFLTKTFSRLFVNLAVQSLVIEACVLAENSHDDAYLEKHDKNTIQHLGFWGWLKSIIGSFHI